MNTTLFILSFVWVAVVGAQQAPILGFVWAPGRAELQAILGIPGSARLSTPVSFLPDVSRIYVAPGHHYALLQGKDSLSFMSLDSLDSGHAVENSKVQVGLPHQTLAIPDIVVFSPRSTSAVLISQRDQRIQILSGLPATPSITLDASTATLFSIIPRILAISDDGTELAFTGDVGRLAVVATDLSESFVGDFPNVSAISFLPGSNDALVCDATQGTVTLFHTRPVAIGTAYALRGITESSPGALAVTDDGKQVLVIDRANAVLWRINLVIGLMESVPISKEIEGIERIRSKDLFLLRTSEPPIGLFMPTVAEPGSLAFVPGSPSVIDQKMSHRDRSNQSSQ